MSEFESIYATTTGELECGCTFNHQFGVIDEGDWRDCAHHASPVRVVRAESCTPPVLGVDAEIVRVRIMLNPDLLASWFGYRPGTPVFPVFAYLSTGTDHMWLCEQAWQVGNYDGHPPLGEPRDALDDLDDDALRELDALTARLVDPHTRELAAVYQRRTDRSLQPGDVVAINDAFYACAGLGWERIDAPFIGHGPIPVRAAVDLHDALFARPVPDLLDEAA